MKPDMTCECGSNLFSPTPVFQTMPNGRVFELASSGGEVKNVWTLRCIYCGDRYVMGKRPDKEQNCTLIKLHTKAAKDFIEQFTTDGVFTNDDALDLPSGGT